MACDPIKVRLQKTLKGGLRRCVYRRWEAEVEGSVLITRTTDLERMYRGNTPYPLGKAKDTRRTHGSPRLAKLALKRASERIKAKGYRSA